MDNLGAASIVAVNTTTGEVLWRYGAVPGDPFDYDTAQTPMLIELQGKKHLVQPNKTGFIHYLDAETGAFIRASPFADHINWTKGYDSMGRPIDMIGVPKEGGEAVEIWPSLGGGVNMYPSAYSPKTGQLYLAATNMGMKYRLEEIKVISKVPHFGTSPEFIFGNEAQMAISANTGQTVWRTDETKPGYSGGMLATAGNLVFYSTQGEFRAVNATSGEIFYSIHLGTVAKAAPMTFQHNGKQYVVQSLGASVGFGRDQAWGTEFGGMVVAFTR